MAESKPGPVTDDLCGAEGVVVPPVTALKLTDPQRRFLGGLAGGGIHCLDMGHLAAAMAGRLKDADLVERYFRGFGQWGYRITDAGLAALAVAPEEASPPQVMPQIRDGLIPSQSPEEKTNTSSVAGSSSSRAGSDTQDIRQAGKEDR